MTEDYYGARSKNRASTHAMLKRSGYADGGTVGSTDSGGNWQIPDSDIATKNGDYDQLKNGAFVLPPQTGPSAPKQATSKKAAQGGQKP